MSTGAQLIPRLLALTAKKDRFTFDLRGECQVYAGIVSAYRATEDSDHFIELPAVIAHALANDGIVGARKDPMDGKTYYDSCRIFTDLDQALRFARQERQRSVFNLNRNEEVQVGSRVRAMGSADARSWHKTHFAGAGGENQDTVCQGSARC